MDWTKLLAQRPPYVCWYVVSTSVKGKFGLHAWEGVKGGRRPSRLE